MAERGRPAVAAKQQNTQLAQRWLTGMAVSVALLVMAGAAFAQDTIKTHGYSFFGELKYPADFPHYGYVNPDAPQGGEMSLATSGTFDSLNAYSRKGRSGALTTLSYDSLMHSPSDTVGEYYGLLAESLEYPADRAWVIFNMRKNATFSDGSPVTAHDVAFSHNLFLEQGLPSYAQAVKEIVTSAEVIDDHTIKFTFNTEKSARSRIEVVGNVPVFSKAWFDADESRRLDEPRLEVAVGSGPWVLESYDINRRIVYKRRADYWGDDLPVNKGRHNFESIRIEYFADQTAQFEAFKAGEFTFRVEGDAKRWASGYDFPRIESGVVVREEIVNGAPPTASGFVFNLARPQFQDKSVREAIALAFNFEWTNESLLYGLQTSRSSFVQGTHLEAKGVPTGAEKAFLESLGDVVPSELFTTEARQSHVSNPDRLNDRRNLRKASKMLQDAGYTVDDAGMLRDSDGQTLKIQMLIPSNVSSTNEGMHETYVQNLRSIGVDAAFEKVDPAQFTLLRREREYDMLYSTTYDGFLSTGGGLSQMYGSKEAEFSLFNPAGLASPLVDAILEKSFVAESQAETEVALTALDRALRYEFFVVPDGFVPVHWVSYFDMYEHPDEMPPFALGSRDFWWINPEKEAALKASGELR